jgi:hypothetical protein
MVKLNIDEMNKYLDKVKNLKGKKEKMANPVTRAIYEDESVRTGRWLTIGEFEDLLKMTRRK